MTPSFHVIIPARYHSTRLPGKMLRDIAGQTVIERVYRQALKSNAETVTIATDHLAIYNACVEFGADVVMTSSAHQSGTDRIAEVIEKKGYDAKEIIVNLQGDEPFIAPALINQVATNLACSTAPMATLCWSISDYNDLLNINVVKVVRDQHKNAMYFSRSPIPMNRDQPQNLKSVYRHIGIYAYRAGFLKEYVTWPVCELESIEALEQLRVLWRGYQIHVDVACASSSQDINTEEDLCEAQAQFLQE